MEPILNTYRGSLMELMYHKTYRGSLMELMYHKTYQGLLMKSMSWLLHFTI
jgi:hypothetical protein